MLLGRVLIRLLLSLWSARSRMLSNVCSRTSLLLAFSHFHTNELQVPVTATAEEIHRAHLKKSRRFHTDKNRSRYAPDVIKSINAAAALLKDADKRRAYDDSQYKETGEVDLFG